MPFMTRIPSDLARFGLKVEVVPGWETRGSPSFAPACVVDHWTAGPRGTTGRPSLNVVVNGRPGLSGPLCNVYLARNGTCVVVAAGRANHAGTGGFRGIVGNSGAYGIEAESGGDGDWTPEMLDAYPRLNAALLSGLGRDASWVCGHNEWTPRKIDIRDIISAVRAKTAAVLANPDTTTPTSEEDDIVKYLAFRNADTGEVRLAAPGQWYHVSSPAYLNLFKARGLCDEPKDIADNEFGFFQTVFLQPEANDGATPAPVDVQGLAATLVPLLVPALQSRTGASQEDVEAAVREVLGSLDNAA